jgi:CTP synthase (UTP-ammonia lyase)
MNETVAVGIIGDYNPNYQSHIATTDSLRHVGEALSINIEASWLPTISIEKEYNDSSFKKYNALWCAPGSPYISIDGALKAIRYARENDVPFIGTCGGFQHVLLEYARNVLGLTDASHEEISPNADTLFISKLSCSLAGKKGRVYIKPDTIAHSIYQKDSIYEEFRCNYGLNPKYADEMINNELIISGFGAEGEPRIIELSDHVFFVATLYEPQLSSSSSFPHPLIKRYIETAQNQ